MIRRTVPATAVVLPKLIKLVVSLRIPKASTLMAHGMFIVSEYGVLTTEIQQDAQHRQNLHTRTVLVCTYCCMHQYTTLNENSSHLSFLATVPVSTLHSTTSFPLEAAKRLLPSEENATAVTLGRPSPCTTATEINKVCTGVYGCHDRSARRRLNV